MNIFVGILHFGDIDCKWTYVMKQLIMVSFVYAVV